MSSIREFAGKCFRSRLGWLLVCVHGAWFLVAIANMSPPAPGLGKFFDQGGNSSAALLAGRPFHFTYESFPLKVIFVSDLPSTLAAAPVGIVLSLATAKLIHVGSFVGSYFGAALMLLAASCQWLIVGAGIESRLSSYPFGLRLLGGVDRHLVCYAYVAVFADDYRGTNYQSQKSGTGLSTRRNIILLKVSGPNGDGARLPSKLRASRRRPLQRNSKTPPFLLRRAGTIRGWGTCLRSKL